MTRLFLTAKHWQLFVLLFIVPLLLYFKTISSMNEGWTSYPPLTVVPESKFFSYLPFLIFIYSLCVAGWFWSLVVGIQKNLEPYRSKNLWFFKLAFIIPIIGVTMFLHGLSYIVMMDAEDIGEYSINFLSIFIDLINPFTVLALICLIDIVWIAAKTLRSAELTCQICWNEPVRREREPALSDYILEFFLLLCYPIGVWWIQPRVNRIISISSQ